MYCKNCGKEISDNAAICIHCGCPVSNNTCIINGSSSRKNWLLTLLLCFFFGSFGVHRYYAGKVVTGILMLITCGGCGIWTIIDFIVIICGNFTDDQGKYIQNI